MIIACTRHIAARNKQRALEQGIELLDYPLVKINYLSPRNVVSVLQKENRNLVFTSKHALLALEEIFGDNPLALNHVVYCINGKTQDYAKKIGLKIKAAAATSMELASCILKDNVKEVLHLTSNIRLTDWYELLASKNINCASIEVYNKEMQEYSWDNYAGIAFFSPSQIDAFLMSNILYKNKPAFCIGHTTGDYAKNKGFEKILISKKPSEEYITKKIIDYYTP